MNGHSIPARLGRRSLLALGASVSAALLACQPPKALVTEHAIVALSQAERIEPRAATGRPPARAVATPTAPPVSTVDDGTLQRQIADFLRGQRGAYSVAVRDLQGPVAAAYESSDRFPLGSLFKLHLLYEVMRQVKAGTLSLGATVQTLPDYNFGEPRGGVPPATRLTIAEAIVPMIAASSNAAALALIEAIGAEQLEAVPRRLSLSDTAIDVAPAGGPGRYSIDARSSARDILTFLIRLDREQLVSSDLDRRMVDVMLKQTIDDRIPLLLPRDVPIAHKTADLDDFTHDAGIVYLPGRPFAIAILAQGLNPTDGKAIVAETARIAFAYFNARR